MLETGSRVGSSLVVDTRLGEGAFAEVYRVVHEFLGPQAMKLFKQVTSLDRTRELLAEARLLSTIGHPNVVRLFDAGTVETEAGVRGWFTMEYVAGGSLEELFAAHRGVVPVAVALQVLEQVAAGLAVAHAQSPPVIHRDLTTANILVGYDGSGMRVRISDFGLAQRADPVTLLASAQGTYAFMAPEVVRGGGYSRGGDVFALGVIGFLLLTNHLPFDDGRPMSSSTARFRSAPTPPSRFNPDVDGDLERLVLAMIDRDPGARPADAVELLEHLGTLRRAAPEPSVAPVAPEPDAGALRLAERAFELARHPAGLREAADLMERAVNRSARLRAEHLPLLMAWRRGVTM